MSRMRQCRLRWSHWTEMNLVNFVEWVDELWHRLILWQARRWLGLEYFNIACRNILPLGKYHTHRVVQPLLVKARFDTWLLPKMNLTLLCYWILLTLQQIADPYGHNPLHQITTRLLFVYLYCTCTALLNFLQKDEVLLLILNIPVNFLDFLTEHFNSWVTELAGIITPLGQGIHLRNVISFDPI